MDSLVVIILLGIFFFLSLINKKGAEIPVLFLAFGIRVAILVVDYLHLFDIPFSGNDSENFHRFAIAKMLGEDVQYTHYTDFLALVYYLTDTSRFFAQALNVVFSYSSILIVRKCCLQIGLNNKGVMVAMSLMAFMPSLVMFSGILLREAWIQFFLVLSLLFFIKWYKSAGFRNALFCVLASLSAAYMHEGMIGILIGYLFAFMVYNHHQGKEKVSSRSFLALIAISVLAIVLLMNLSSFGGKLGRVQDEDFLESEIQANEAGSAYLQWMAGSSYATAIILSPIRMIYFLFSPLPFDWRGIMDVIVFMIDSMVYLVLLIRTLRHYRFRRPLRKYILISFLFVTMIFSIGTNNSGTALRHRAKLFPMLVLCLSVASVENSTTNLRNTYRLN